MSTSVQRIGGRLSGLTHVGLILLAVAPASAAMSPVSNGAASGSRALPSTGESFAIRAERVHVGDGSVLREGTVVVNSGKIVAVLEKGAQAPDGIQVVEHDGDLSAGMIALQDTSGAEGEDYDSTRALLPDADLAHAFRPAHSDFERLVSEGITSVVLAPSPSAVAGGLTAVVKTHGCRVLKRRAHLELSLASGSLKPDRYPTSYSGALGEFEARLAAGEGAFGEAKSGSLPVAIRANGKHEVQRAVAFAKRHNLKGAIVGASRGGELADELKQAGLAVIYRPFTPGMETRSLRSVAKLAEAGVAFGFGLDAPLRHPSALRLGAAACVREGLAADAAWRALTADAARIAGVDDATGVVAVGKDADLVLWSANPMDLGSSVVAVFVDGERAFGGDR